MKYKIILAAIAMIAVFTQCHSHSKKTENENKPIIINKIHDGLYLVLNEFSDTLNIKKSTGKIVTINPDFLEKKYKGEAVKIEVDTTDFVPLELSSAPDSIVKPDKKVTLLLTLTDSASKKLADFSAKNLNKKVALIIDGMTVTMHKIKSKITNGKVQLTRCTDNACRMIYIKLKEDYKKKTVK